MKKILVLGILMLIVTGCQKSSDDFSFVDYGLNKVSNTVIKSADGKSLVWVKQRESTSAADGTVDNVVLTSKVDGTGLVEVLVKPLAKTGDEDQAYLRVMGYYPEIKVLVYAIESKNKDFGSEFKRELYYVYLDTLKSEKVGDNYFAVFKTNLGIQALRGGKTLSVYQFSVKNTFALDTVINYSKDKEVSLLFTDALVSPDLAKVVYALNYDPRTQGTNENRLMSSNLEGGDRKELLTAKEPIKILEFDGVKVKVLVGLEEKVLELNK